MIERAQPGYNYRKTRIFATYSCFEPFYCGAAKLRLFRDLLNLPGLHKWYF